MNFEPDWRKIPLSELSQRVGSLKDFYHQLSHEGYYLPEYSPGTVTAEYLLGVLTNNFFNVKREEISLGLIEKKVSKIDLHQAFKEATPLETGFPIIKMQTKIGLETASTSLNRTC